MLGFEVRYMAIEYIVKFHHDERGIAKLDVTGDLIRCKDCAYCQEDGFCPITDCYDFGDEDFCSKGERKEE